MRLEAIIVYYHLVYLEMLHKLYFLSKDKYEISKMCSNKFCEYLQFIT